jgi:Na+-translocating ferredoxin:NAD+ oxidoreductase RNF subunit RnfB
MNILGLIEKFLNRGDALISVNPDFCVRLKTPMAGCYECIDRCPDLSIKITDNDIKILENCTNCNACLYICPNSVFHVKNNALEERNVKQAPDGNVYYFCSKIENKEVANKTECLYGIEDIDIVSLIKKGNKIFFIAGGCKSCKLKYLHNKKLKRVNEIKKFLNKENAFTEININDFDYGVFLEEQVADNPAWSIKNKKNKNGESGKDGKCNQEAEALNRRDFFKNSIKAVKNNAKKIIEDVSVEDLPLSELYSEYIDAGVQGGKKINKLLIERQKKIYLFLKYNEEILPILNVRLPVLNGNCVFCSNCWELCPTGALTFKMDKIFLEPFLCTGCNLCKDICSFRAVKMYKAKNLKDISGEKVLLEQPKDERL